MLTKTSLVTCRIWLEHNGYSIENMTQQEIEEAGVEFSDWLFNLFKYVPYNESVAYIEGAVNGEISLI